MSRSLSLPSICSATYLLIAIILYTSQTLACLLLLKRRVSTTWLPIPILSGGLLRKCFLAIRCTCPPSKL